MQFKLLASDVQRSFVVLFDEAEEVVSALQDFACDQELSAAEFTGLGAFSSAVLGFFDPEKKDYERIEINEQVEVLTMVGNVAQHKDGAKLHSHVVLGKRDGTAIGGHLLEASVCPTLEVMLTESPGHIRRSKDEKTGLPLIDLEE